MGAKLTASDEGIHPVGEAANWNESRYVDFFDPSQGVGGWLRIGNRPNEAYAEMSVCVNLPSGRAAFMFDRAPIGGNGLAADGQVWEVVDPFVTTRVRYDGQVLVLPDPWVLADPKTAFRVADRSHCRIDLTSYTQGLRSVMGADQDHIDRIFLPGQAAWHYQHLARTIGTVEVGEESWDIEGMGGKDHSWGPRNWHAKIYLRWLIAMVDADFGFMLVRAVGPTKRTRSGFVWDRDAFRLVDDFELHNTYGGPPHFELRQAEVAVRAEAEEWSAVATPVSWVPLRHRQRGADGELTTLRIVKSPTDWRLSDGRIGAGMCEYHDIIENGLPVGLHD
jgi:hypothetical protein